MTIDIKNIYLHTPIDRYEYVQISIKLIHKEFIVTYNLHDKIHKGFVYVETDKDIYWLPQAWILESKFLKAKLQLYG